MACSYDAKYLVRGLLPDFIYFYIKDTEIEI